MAFVASQIQRKMSKQAALCRPAVKYVWPWKAKCHSKGNPWGNCYLE